MEEETEESLLFLPPFELGSHFSVLSIYICVQKMSFCMADQHLFSPIFCQWVLWRSLSQLLITGASSQQHTCLSLHSVQSVSQVFVKLLAELTLATPGLLSSSTASATEFLASVSFVEVCATERCFIRVAYNRRRQKKLKSCLYFHFENVNFPSGLAIATVHLC